MVVDEGPSISYQHRRFEVSTLNGWTSVESVFQHDLNWWALTKDLSRSLAEAGFCFRISDSDRSVVRGVHQGRPVGSRLLLSVPPLPRRPVPLGWRRFAAPGKSVPWFFTRDPEYPFEQVFDAVGLGDLPYLFAAECRNAGGQTSTVVVIDPSLASPEVDSGAPHADVRTHPFEGVVGQPFEHFAFTVINDGGGVHSLTLEFADEHPGDLIRVTNVRVGGISSRLPSASASVTDGRVTVPVRVLPSLVAPIGGQTMRQALAAQVAQMETSMLTVALSGTVLRPGSGPVTAMIRLEGDGVFERRLWLPVDAQDPAPE
jgi:hypothetical protein